MVLNTMVKAFIMVKAGSGEAEALSNAIGTLNHVTEVNVVAGDFDLIVEAEADAVYDVINAAATEIRGLADVDDTKTYVCLE